MSETADFTLRLRDETSGPAKRAARGVDQLKTSLRGAASDARATERAWQSALTKRRQLTPSPPRIDRGLSVAFQRRRLERGAAEGMVRRQAQIEHAGGLSRLAQIEGTAVGGLGMGTGTAAGLGAVAAIGTAAVAAGAGVAYLTAKFVGATAAALDFGQRSKLAFSSLLGDSTMGAATFEQVRREAQKLGLDVHDTVDSFRDLLAAQFEVGEAKELMRASADLKAIGADAERVKLALLALTQIKMKGVLQAEEMRQLVNTGVSAELIYNNLGKRLGKTREQILAMQRDRQITAADAIEAFKEAIKEKTHEQNLGDTAKMFANSKISGMLAQVRAQVDNAFITLGGRLEPRANQLAKLIFGTFQRIADSPAFQRFSDKLVEGFGGAVDFLQRNWTSIEGFIVRTVDTIVDTITGAIDFTRNHWDEITAAMKGAGIALGLVAVAAAVASVGVITLTAPVLALAGAAAYLTAKLVDGSAEMGRWLKLAGAVAMLIPGMSSLGGATQILGNVADRGGTLPTLEDQIRNESRARVAGNAAAAGQAGRLLGSGSGATSDNSKRIGQLTVPTTFQSLDPEQIDGIESKWEGMVRRAVGRVFEET